MQPRVLFRTHYQVDEPEFVGILIRKCCSPVEGAYDEIIAEKFTREIRRRGKRFNIAAGKYAVDLAKGLGVLNEHGCWTEKGHLLSLLTKDKTGELDRQFELNDREKLAYFRLFLEADGAAFAFIGQRTLERGQLPYEGCTWNSLTCEMFKEIYLEYLPITNITADRVSLRNEIERLRKCEYRGNTGAHKAFIHLQTLHRLGLLERIDVGGGRTYQLPKSSDLNNLGIVRLLSEINEVQKLEKIIKEKKWPELAVRIFDFSPNWSGDLKYGAEHERLSVVLARVYLQIMSTGIPLCPLTTLIDTTQVEMLSQHSVLITLKNILNHLDMLRKDYPKSVRFHVDRQGRPAYLLLSESAVSALSGR